METFVRIVDLGSMSRAAAAMGLSPTTVSTYLAFLEGHLGRRLLDRSTRRLDLTEDGRRFLDEARLIVNAVTAAENATRGGGAKLRGRVRIDVPTSIGHRYLLPTLPAFMAAHPAIELDLVLGDRASTFRSDGFDVLVRVGETGTRDAETRLLTRSRYVHVASPGYLARRGVPLVPADLQQHDCILYNSFEQPGGRMWTFRHDGQVERINARSILALNDGTAIATAASAGLGIARTLAMLVADEIADGRLVAVLDLWTDEPLPIYAIAPADRAQIPVVAAALTYLESIGWAQCH